MSYSKLEDTFHGSPKIRRLAFRLECTPNEARGYLATLWSWVQVHAPDGDLRDFSPVEVEYPLEWRGEPGELFGAMVETGFIDECEGYHEIHEWMERAQSYKKAAQTKNRRKEKASRNTRGTRAEHARNESPKNGVTRRRRGEERRGEERKGEERREEPKRVMEIWNSVAPAAGLPRAEKLTKTRRAAINARAKDSPDINWREYFEQIGESEFCRGGGETGWVATFDWAIKEDSIVKTLEGKYNTRAGGRGKQEDRAPRVVPTAEETARRSEELERDIQRATPMPEGLKNVIAKIGET